MEDEVIYTEDKITIIRPLKANHIFNEEKYDKIETYSKEGDKLIILREKKHESTISDRKG